MPCLVAAQSGIRRRTPPGSSRLPGFWTVAALIFAGTLTAGIRDACAAERGHTVRDIFLDGNAVSSAGVSIVLPGSTSAATGIHVGQAIADGTRLAVPPHVSVVVVSTDTKSTATLQPGADVTFVSTGSGEVVAQHAGTSLFSVVSRALDFFRVQSGGSITAGVRGTEFAVTSKPGAVTIACTSGAVDVEKTGYLQVGAVVQRVSLADVVSPAQSPEVTYHPTQIWYLARFENYGQAHAAYEKALSQARATGDRHAIAVALDNLGTVERSLGRLSDAMSAHAQSRALFEQLGERDGAALARMHIGNVEFNLSRYADALASHQQALVIFRQLGDRDGEARALGNIGNAVLYLGRSADALAYQQQALALCREVHDGDGEAKALLNMGLAQEDLSRYSDALSSYASAWTLFRELENLDGEASTIGSIGVLQLRIRRYADAIDSFQQAAAIFRRLGNRDGEASGVSNVGIVQSRLGRFSEALASERQALAVFREIGNRTGQAAALNSIGLTQWRLGAYTEAVTAYRDALALYEQLGRTDNVAFVRDSITAIEAHKKAP